ncbi:Gti1/Pac2 family protein ASCRUDRAFT_93798 [Ascoidea rubescens DSM 1968]|uniref:cAMP-independent regulatory protein pac2 n=1 Tax=Ascoidea rubescens DSM 1968 TaxID=1344418 RepID=A0A1D2VNX2_9ASCO|nr:hypothetical protein ASCRUDRAFT_93798 [Ascoidea rubescens DSM 1968]ODV63267.1 hypothetical protein ASCRUDRAFT_93798 [Ascoidea rubescens DSM 1968]
METYHGMISSTNDAILLMEATRLSILPKITRRLTEHERKSIKSGSIYIWDEEEAGMRRWTDGRSWSASRVSGCFLNYKEMESNLTSKSNPQNNSHSHLSNLNGLHNFNNFNNFNNNNNSAFQSNMPMYSYKIDGLIKQSFSLNTKAGKKLHLIAYLNNNIDINNHNLMIPTKDPKLQSIKIPDDIYPEEYTNPDSDNINDISEFTSDNNNNNTNSNTITDANKNINTNNEGNDNGNDSDNQNQNQRKTESNNNKTHSEVKSELKSENQISTINKNVSSNLSNSSKSSPNNNQPPTITLPSINDQFSSNSPINLINSHNYNQPLPPLHQIKSTVPTLPPLNYNHPYDNFYLPQNYTNNNNNANMTFINNNYPPSIPSPHLNHNFPPHLQPQNIPPPNPRQHDYYNNRNQNYNNTHHYHHPSVPPSAPPYYNQNSQIPPGYNRNYNYNYDYDYYNMQNQRPYDPMYDQYSSYLQNLPPQAQHFYNRGPQYHSSQNFNQINKPSPIIYPPPPPSPSPNYPISSNSRQFTSPLPPANPPHYYQNQNNYDQYPYPPISKPPIPPSKHVRNDFDNQLLGALNKSSFK